MNKSVLWIIIVVILLVVLGVIFLGGGNEGGESTTPTSTTPGDNQNSTTTSQSSLDNLPPATGNVSDIASDILKEAGGVSSLPDQTDPSLTQVGNEVNNFDQFSDVQF
jgi:hypothetical protein